MRHRRYGAEQCGRADAIHSGGLVSRIAVKPLSGFRLGCPAGRGLWSSRAESRSVRIGAAVADDAEVSSKIPEGVAPAELFVEAEQIREPAQGDVVGGVAVAATFADVDCPPRRLRRRARAGKSRAERRGPRSGPARPAPDTGARTGAVAWPSHQDASKWLTGMGW